MTWLVIAVVGGVTMAFKAAGPVLLGHRELPARVASVVDVLAPAMLAALVVTQTVGGDGGRILVANEKNFPFLVSSKSDGSNAISGAVAFLEPCGMNPPHTHPRATQILTVVEGELEVGFVMENGLFAAAAKDINALAFPFNTTVQQFEATIFPQGSIHFQFNPTCERSIFVAALNSADPGTSQIAQNFFVLDSDIVDITLGVTEGGNKLDPSNVDQFRKNLPANLVLAVDSCKAKCGM